MKQLISIILLLALMLTIFAGCAADESGDIVTTTNGNASDDMTESDDTPKETLREDTRDTLPDDLNFDGQEIRILHRSEDVWGTEITSESEIGEVVNDAIYNRNRNVEERLNVKITAIPRPGVWDNTNNFLNYVRTSIQAGDSDYDLIAGYAYFITGLALEGLFINWNTVDYIDPTQDWWSADFANEMTIFDKLYFVAGDLSLTMLQSLFVVYFNKQMAVDFSLGNLYQIVLDGGFTLDKMEEFTKSVYQDINGDGAKDPGDRFGVAMTTGNFVDAFFNAFAHPITTKDGDGVPQLSLNTPKMIEMVNKVYTFLHENESSFTINETTDNDNLVSQMFAENRVLFNLSFLKYSSILRSMDSDYGIIPYPKWDEAQLNYHTAAQDGYSLFSIPVTCTIADTVGAVTEALCAESYRRVTPAYYEVTLKAKYSRDEETSQMLDLIRSGLTFNFGTVNSFSMDNMGHIFRNLVTSKSTDFTSTYEKSQATYQAKLDAIVAAYKDLP